MKTRMLNIIAFLALSAFQPTTLFAEPCGAVDQYLTWRGGAAYTGIEGLELTGALRTSGLEGNAKLQMRRDGYSLLDYDLKVISGTNGLTPEGAWEKSFSGQIDEMGDESATNARRELDQVFSLSLQNVGKGNVVCLGEEKKDEKAYEVVRVQFENDESFDYFVRSDGTLDWVRELKDKKTSWTRYSDWREVKGVRFAFLAETFKEDPGSNTEIRWQNISSTAHLSKDVFTKPEGSTKLLSFSDGASSSGWIDFNFFKQRRIFIDGLVNGIETPIILDSGAEMTVISQKFASKAGLVSTGELNAQGVAGSTTASIVNDVTIELGNLKASGLTAVVIDMQEISKGIGHPVPVVFGEEVFNELVVDVDYPNERIAFHHPDSFDPEPLREPLDIVSIKEGQKEVMVSINGLPAAPVGLDTGSRDTISIYESWGTANRITDGMKTSTHLSGGVGGMTVSLKGTVDTIQLGNITLKDVPVTFSRADKGAFTTTKIAGNMGVQIFREFRTTFDFGRDKLYLTPDPSYPQPAFDRDRSGIQTIKEDSALTVVHVCKGGPAEQEGWREGDRITEINGESIGDDYWDKVYGWASNPAGTTVMLTTIDGARKELILADYY